MLQALLIDLSKVDIHRCKFSIGWFEKVYLLSLVKLYLAHYLPDAAEGYSHHLTQRLLLLL